MITGGGDMVRMQSSIGNIGGPRLAHVSKINEKAVVAEQETTAATDTSKN